MAKYVNSERLQKNLFKRTERYAKNVRDLYNIAILKLIDIAKNVELEEGKPFSFDAYGYKNESTAILRGLYSSVYKEIRGDSEKEWMLSNDHNDKLVQSVFGKNSISDNHYSRFFNRNKEAMDAFLNRKDGTDGLNLSQKVWRYVGQLKVELEDSLDLAIGEGTGANRMATKIKEYLQDPDRFYRRFRVKIGEDENGDPIYGRQWKRKVFDKETGLYKWINEDPKKYNPGRGVYRSSYRNAQRLARTETNISYRSADYERWEQLDFVVGIEIKLSNNHPVYDICDELKGVYPKHFKWTGWHPNCRCYMVPVLANDDEIWSQIDKILSDDEPTDMQSSESVHDYPKAFTEWITTNSDRISKAEQVGTLPYFIADNRKYIGI